MALTAAAFVRNGSRFGLVLRNKGVCTLRGKVGGRVELQFVEEELGRSVARAPAAAAAAAVTALPVKRDPNVFWVTRPDGVPAERGCH